MDIRPRSYNTSGGGCFCLRPYLSLCGREKWRKKEKTGAFLIRMVSPH